MLVVDASVIVKAIVAEKNSPEAISIIRREPDLLVPAHCFAEVGETLVRKIRIGQALSSQIESIMATMIETFAQTPLDILMADAMRIAQETGASVYDCLYVALAATQSCGFVTADRRLIAKMAGTPNARLLTPLDSFSGSP